MNEALVVSVRALIGFFTLLIFTRLLGKQQISQLTYFDYILGITIGSTASSLTVDLTSRAWEHWVGLIIWIIIVLLLQWITLKSRAISKYIDGEPSIVIMNGKIMENNMRKMRLRLSELMEQLRVKGIFSIKEVEFAVLETNGKLSVQKKSQYQPLTPEDMNLETNYKGLSTELIYDGIIIEPNLKQINLDKNWLINILNKNNIYNPAEVFFADLSTDGFLYIDMYDDNNIKIPVEVSDDPQKRSNNKNE